MEQNFFRFVVNGRKVEVGRWPDLSGKRRIYVWKQANNGWWNRVEDPVSFLVSNGPLFGKEKIL